MEERKQERGGEYSTVISLGCFCGVAQEMERFGLRSFSAPFDWLITEEFELVLQLIDTHFENFFQFDALEQQYAINPAYYFDSVNRIQIYHDFSAFQPLEKQYGEVIKKYKRRIDQFYRNIQKPSLFIRYCEHTRELRWIDDHYEEIIRLLKDYNIKNDIIFIGGDEYVFQNKKIRYFHTPRTPGDYVARKAFSAHPDLQKMMEGNIIPEDQKIKNFQFYENKQKRKYIHKVQRKIKKIFDQVFRTPYRYEKQREFSSK